MGTASNNTMAEAAKSVGNELLAKGDIEGAIEKYSEAIKIDSDNHIYYSNRCAAYMKSEMYSLALADANQCIQLAPDWAKGYSRLAAAYEALGDPRATTTREKANSMSGTGGGATGNTGNGTNAGAVKVGTLELVGFGLQVFFLVNTLISIIPNTGSSGAFQRALLSIALCYILELYRDYRHYIGKPMSEIAQMVSIDWRAQYTFIALLFTYIGSNRTVYLLPHLVSNLGRVVYMVMKKWPQVASKANEMLPVSSVLYRVTRTPTEADWIKLPISEKWSKYNQMTLDFSASLEVALLISLLVELFSPYRSILGIFAYTNILKMRYMTSMNVRNAFKTLDSRILGFSGRIPFLNTVYMKIRAFCARQVDVGSYQQGGQSQQDGLLGTLRNQMSSCSIM